MLRIPKNSRGEAQHGESTLGGEEGFCGILMCNEV